MKTTIYKFNSKKSFFVFFLIISLVSLTGCKPHPPQISIVFESELSTTVPDVLSVYVNKPEKWSQDSLYKKFKMLKLESTGKIQENDLGYIYITKSFFFQLSPKTGAEMFMDSSRFMVEVPGQFPLMDDKSIITLATRYIGENLGIKPTEIKYIKIQHLHNAVQESGGKVMETIDESIGVFKRNIDGIDIVGYGGFIRIHFDNRGYVTGYQKEWRNWKLYKQELKVIPYSRAKEEFMRIMKAQLIKGGMVKVTGVNFGYFERGFFEKQTYLQPAYVFKTVFLNKETKKSTAARLVVIPAIEQPLEPLVVDTDLSSQDENRP
jgi:hypothetical protein